MTDRDPSAVRAARVEDVPVLLALIRELAVYEREPEAVVATERDLEAAVFGAAPSVFAHVAIEHGQVVGFALWYVTYSSWLGRHGMWLEDLFVRPAHRGAGHGQRLLAALARICIDRGYGRLEWWVLDWNEPSLGFYRSLGAEPMSDWTVHRLDGEVLRAVAHGWATG